MNDMFRPSFDFLVVDRNISSSGDGPLHLLADPIDPLDAATKQYVDGISATSSAIVSGTPPASPANGDLWFDSVSGQTFVWYTDANSSQWVIVSNTGVQDAPVSTTTYGRHNGNWEAVLPLTGGTMVGPLVLHQDPTGYFMAATKGYVDLSLQTYLPLIGGHLLGRLFLLADPVSPMEAATKQYVESQKSIITVSDVPPRAPVQGQVWFDSAGVETYVWFIDGKGAWVPLNTESWTVAPPSGSATGGTVPEAPMDGQIYGRNGTLNTWEPVVPISGGTLSGPLNLPLVPILPSEATSKSYVDAVAATGALWQGTYRVGINSPALDTMTPANGASWTAVTSNPGISEPLTVTLPGIAAGTMIFNGDTLRYNSTSSIWYQIRSGAVTKSQADSTYVFRSGDKMKGSLVLSGPPTQALEAATKSYVDATRPAVSTLPPGTPAQGQFWYDLSASALKIWIKTSTSESWVTV